MTQKETKLIVTPETTLAQMVEMAFKKGPAEIKRILPLEQGAYEVSLQ